MSSSVCQRLQSCLEPRLVEPRVLIQNLAPPKSNFSQSIPITQKPNVSQPQQEQNEMNIHNAENNKNIIINDKYYYNFVEAEHESNKLHGIGDSVWSSIQALTTTCQNHKQVTDAEQVYVHPLVKRSSSMLSTKSLEMCTESLGSETGSSIDESIDDFPKFPSPLLERRNFEGIQRSSSREFTKKMDPSGGFPPPLTSISGTDGVQVRHHREGGRLVLKAVTVSSCSSYFQAERANGRLRLSLLKDGTADSNIIHDLVDEYEENAYNIMQHDEEDHAQENENADEGGDEIEDISEDDVNRSCQWEDDELEVNGENVGYEIGGIGEFPRPSRCKLEGGETTRNQGIPNWGALKAN